MKKTRLLILFIVLSVVSCVEKNISDKLFLINANDEIIEGTLKSVTPFQIEGENGKRYIRKKGGVGGINLFVPELDKLYNAEQIITEKNTAILIIGYPEDNMIGYTIQNKNGFNKKEVVIEFNRIVSAIYDEKGKYEFFNDEFSDLELKNVITSEKDNTALLFATIESKR